MSGTDLPSVGHPARDPAKKVDGDAEVEAVMGKYDDLKRTSQELDQFFVWPEDSRLDIAHDSFDFELPIIDLSPVLKLDALQRELEQGSNRQALTSEIESCLAAKSSVEKEIRAACEEYGFFQIINHGFPMSLVDQLKQTFIELFSLPLEAWTNGQFISAQHRVVANEKAQRYSIAYFVHCEGKQVIRPTPELVDAKHPLRYRSFRSFTRDEYLQAIFSGGLNQGLNSTNKRHLLDRAFAAESEA